MRYRIDSNRPETKGGYIRSYPKYEDEALDLYPYWAFSYLPGRRIRPNPGPSF